jgi:hypothetical protein
VNESLKNKARSSLLWNAGEAFLYQSFFLMHQLLLFTYTSKTLYGSLGALFASLYFGITIFNGSFDSVLVSYFAQLSNSKKTFYKFFTHFFIPQSLILFIFSLASGLFFLQIKDYAPFHLQQFLTYGWVALMTSFIFLEGTKKNLRALLHLAFKNKKVAYIEVGNIIFYTSLVWSSYFYGIRITPYLLTTYFVLTSALTVAFLLGQLFYYYQTLSIQKKDIKIEKSYFFSFNRTAIYINQLCRSLFSSNFLLPFFAFHAGFKEVGIISLVNTLTFSTTFFIQKIFGPTSSALFASTKQLDTNNKQSAFLFIHKKCLYTVYTVLLLFLLNGYHLFYITQKTVSFHILILVALFFCSHILETLFIVYEKLFIAENKSHYILACNIISFIGCIGAGYFLTQTSFILTLLTFMVIRLLTFCALTFIAKKLWNLSSSTQLTSKDLAAPLLFSLFLSCILKMTL